MSNDSTWVELNVKCSDDRWGKINTEESPHITLAYLGRQLSDRAYQDVVAGVGSWHEWLKERPRYPNLSFAVSGYDLFAGSTVVLKLEPKGILHARDMLVTAIEAGLVAKVDKTYDFVPHVTIGHTPYQFTQSLIPTLYVYTDKLTLVHQGVRTEWDLPYT